MKSFVTHPDFPDLKYYPSSGNFRWRVARRGVIRNSIAGSYRGGEGYISIMYESKYYSAHRLAYLFMTGEWPVNQIDHDNRIRNDNKWTNLNPATVQQNAKNRRRGSRNKSGIVGVMWRTRGKAWEVTIGNTYVGWFKSKEEAIKARKKAEKKLNYHPNHGN